MTKNIRLELSQKTSEFYNQNSYESIRKTCFDIVEEFPIIFQKVMNEIKGMFTEKELLYLFDMRNGTIFNVNLFSTDIIIYEIEDSDSIEHLNDKWQIDTVDLKAKIQSLSISQLYYFMKWIDWNWKVSESNIFELCKKWGN